MLERALINVSKLLSPRSNLGPEHMMAGEQQPAQSSFPL